MSLSKSILPSLLLLSTTISCFSQSIALNFLQYNTTHGLGSNNVRKTIQDSKGYIWCATQDGLFRFDGKNFFAYNKSLSANHSLSGADIRDLLIQNDTLWCISSYGGIDAIDIITGNVVYRYNQQRNEKVKSALFLSIILKNHTLFIGTDKGLYLFDIRKKTLISCPINNATPSDSSLDINKIILDSFDKLWLFCSKGPIYILDISTMQIIGFYNSNIARFYDCELIDFMVLTGTSDGIKQFSFQNGRVKSVLLPIEAQNHQQTPVFSIKKDKQGNVWFSDKNNLLKIDRTSANVQYVYSGKLVNGKDLTSSVYGICFDDKNNLWLSCQEGLLFSTNKPTAFLAYSKSRSSETAITHSYYLFPFNDTTLFVCAEDGLYKVNPLSFSIVSIDLKKTYFYAFLDFKKNVIVSNDEGTFILKNNRLIPFSDIYPEFRNYGVVMLNSCIRMNDSLFVLGTQNKKGIYLWNHKKMKVINIHTGSRDTRLADDNVNTLFKDTDETFLVLCDNSTSVYNIRTGLISELNIENPETKIKYTIFFDVCKIKSSYYLASYSNGLIELDNDYRYKRIISNREGLSSNGIYKVLPYKDSLIVATTNNGISAINLNNGGIKNYYENDGLQSNVFEELSGNSKNNILYAGGKDGFTILSPALFLRNLQAPAVLVNTIRIETASDRIDTMNLNIKEMVIPNTAKQTSIHFSIFNYPNPANTHFSYKIIELHSNWINLNTQNFITLIGLSPGTYHLQVQAFNEDGVPSEIKQLTLIFLPKWYQTWWFKLLLVLLGMAAVYGLYRIRISQLKKEQQIRSKLASDLHDDLGSTMNSVKVYANLAIMEKQDKYLFKIKESTQEAITGIRDMIWVLDDSKDSIEHLLSRISLFAAPLSEANGILYKQEIADDARDHKLGQEERRNLYMMLKEAVNNAIKYSGAKKIEMEVSVKKGKPAIQIKDDGKGFDIKAVSEGNGLKNMKRRSQQIKYQVSLQSEPGNGTNILFQKN